jgi:competence protein ComEC
MRRYALLVSCLGILIGSVLPYVYSLSVVAIALSLCLSIAFAGMLIIQRPLSVVYLVCFCLFLGSTLGLLRSIPLVELQHTSLKEYVGMSLPLRGTITEYPDERIGYTFLTLGNVSTLNMASSTNVRSEYILVRAPLYPRYHYGDRIEVVGKLTEPNNSFGTSTSRFSYKKYLATSNIYTTVGFPKISLVMPAEKSFIGALYLFKDRCIEIVTSYIVEPAAGLLVGILFGIKQALAKSVLSDFTTAGIIHIVVLSGYNIAVIITLVTSMLRFVPNRVRTLLVYTSVLLFILFVGASPTVVRAGIMAAIALYVRGSGREVEGLTLLGAAAAAMTLYEPRLLLYDPSFQLSFLATIGLIVWTPRLQNIFTSVTTRFGLREIVASTCATQLVVLPYILWYMGKVSLLGFITNIIVVPLVPLVMALGTLTLILGLIYLPLSMPVAYITYGLLMILIWIASSVALLPFGTITATMPTITLLLLYLLQIYYLCVTSTELVSETSVEAKS